MIRLGHSVLAAYLAASCVGIGFGEVTARADDAVTDAELPKLVESLFERDVDYLKRKRLKSAGKRATPLLVKSLSDTKRVTTSFSEASQFGPHLPLDAITDIVTREHLPEIVAPLAKLLEHVDPNVRRYAAGAIGRLGSKECLAPIIKALDDSDAKVFRDAIIGLNRSFLSTEWDASFRAGLFPQFERIVRDKAREGDERIPYFMLKIDRLRAMTSLNSPEVLSIENRQAKNVLYAFRNAGEKVDLATLLPLLAAVKPLIARPPYDSLYGEALIAYGRNPDDKAEAMLRTEVGSPEKLVRSYAAGGLAELYGVAGAHNTTWARYDQSGLKGLTAPQRIYMGVRLCMDQAGRSGVSQFLSSSSGDHWKEAVAGFEAIGAAKHAKLLHEALALFGADGPSAEQRMRERQLESFTPERKQALEKIDTEFRQLDKDVSTLLALFAVAHPKDFRE